ncbi:hypothetical protein LJC49_00855 [Ruminococcaceae bacterium OttesenSCG-928-I18]|nr:hypothetical protein [Ruminococcaceae bacterium OttesenSCG-928-I18]
MRTNEHLAMLYIQSRDLSGLQPGDLLVLYKEVLAKINEKEDELYQLHRKISSGRSILESETLS